MINRAPDIFAAHDYRLFLKEHLNYLENSQRDFSLRSLARSAKVSVGYLSMVLSGHRNLSTSMLRKLAPHLKLSDSEIQHLELLISLSDGQTQSERAGVLQRIQKSKAYRDRNPQEFETYHYLSHWYFVAIRELSMISGFKLDAKWIQARLREPVPLSEIEKAITFLTTNGFIQMQKGKAKAAERNLQCMGGVYRLALGKFHKEMLAMAADSIDVVASEDRHLLGHTFSFSSEKLPEVKSILDEALKKIEALGEKSKSADSVYHVELAAVPLTKKIAK